ncbi:hypothetical protein [Saccharothrix syringae]|uniref:hypothetical protein n=1 Tax=Saccharothrix syringae TaxID=103733 RepID=UPI000524EFBF|nr:hypothetical protein [Saccharothrix syringae]
MGITIGGDATGAVFEGDDNRVEVGDITVGGRVGADRVAEVRAALADLRAEVEAAPEGTPRKESALDAVDDLDEELARERPRPEEVAKRTGRLSERVTSGLAAAAGVALLVERLGNLFG